MRLLSLIFILSFINICFAQPIYEKIDDYTGKIIETEITSESLTLNNLFYKQNMLLRKKEALQQEIDKIDKETIEVNNQITELKNLGVIEEPKPIEEINPPLVIE